MGKYDISTDTVLSDAIEKCLTEMYDKAQPSISWDEIKRLSKEGVYNQENSFINQHYLPNEEYAEIVDKYVYAYGFKNRFQENCDAVLDYLMNGGHKDKYIESYTDENGNYHPGYRSYEKTPKLRDVIGEEHAEKCAELIKDCKDFYDRNRTEVSFRFSVMNYSPTSNIETARRYWENKDKNVVIKERFFNEDEEEWQYVEE